MELWQLVTGCIVSLIAAALGVYVSFAARCKGPILSNSYLLLTKKEQKRADKKAEYKLVSIIFGCLTLAFAFLALYIFTLSSWFYILMWIALVAAIVYAVVDSAKTIKGK